MKKLLLILFISLSFSCYASSNENANKLFVESVKQWQEYEASEDLDSQYELLSQINQNIQKIIDKYPGSNIAVQLIAFREFGILSVDKVEKRLAKIQLELAHQNKKEHSSLTCDEPAIIKFANNLINSRGKLSLKAKRVGVDAAYLLIRYEDLSYLEARNLFDNLKSFRKPHRLSNLETAYEIHKKGFSQTLDINSLESSEWLAKNTNPSSLRSLILYDEGKTYLNLIQSHRANAAKDEAVASYDTFLSPYMLVAPITLAINDQSDEFKLNFARAAESKGELITAGMVLSTRKDLEELKEFRNRYKFVDNVFQFLSENTLVGWGSFAQYQDQRPYFSSPINEVDKDRINYNQDLFDIIKASYFVPEYDFLLITHNQSGLTNEIANVSRKYLEAREIGIFSTDTLADEHWIFIYSALIDELGKERAESITYYFDVDLGGRAKFGDEYAHEIVAAMASFKKLTPFVLGETKTIPNRPKIIPDDFNWEMFADVAEIVKKNPDDISYLDTLNEEELLVAYEFLFILGEFDKLLITIDDKNYGIKQSYMNRLDASCRNYKSYPGRALFIQDFYQFD